MRKDLPVGRRGADRSLLEIGTRDRNGSGPRYNIKGQLIAGSVADLRVRLPEGDVLARPHRHQDFQGLLTMPE
jgi:hypothetical protein